MPSFKQDERSRLEKQNMGSDNEEQPAGDVPGEDVWKLMKTTGKKVFYGIEKAGEFFADAFGVTTPRYHMYLDDAMEYEQLVLEAKEKHKMEVEQPKGGSWINSPSDGGPCMF